MTIHTQIDSRIKNTAKVIASSLLAATMLAACSGGETTRAEGQRTAYEVSGDHAIGNADAPITVVEYASVTCTHCATWHASVWPKIQSKYIDTGKVRFVFREFPTPPVNLAMAGFLIANCAEESQYFSNISLQFERQNQLINSARNGRAAQEYQALAKAAGLSEAAYEACLANEEERERLNAVVEGGYDRGVDATPSFFINGEKKSVFKLEDFEKEFANFIEIEKSETDEGKKDDVDAHAPAGE